MTTTRADIPVPGLLWGANPERRATPRHWADRGGTLLRGAADRLADAADVLRRRRDAAWLARVRAAQATLAQQDDSAALAAVRTALWREGLAPAALLQALALAANTARRCLGVQPFDTQLIAARAVLDNQLAEMATGEGKTLAVALAAAVGALAGMPVHVVTANDYLVARDAQRLQPLAQALGLTVGCVVQADDPAERQRAYACDITFVTAKELVFDYLRDGLAGARPLLRGLCLAIVDEADAILIDEARVPLILSQPGDAAASQAHTLRFARTLHQGTDFVLDTEHLAAHLTDAGRGRLERAAASLAEACHSPAWRNRLHREHAVGLALAAEHLYESGRHYLVRDGAVQIVDATTGRVAEGRVWSDGLQQLIEVKEGCTPTAPMQTLAQITYQRFFPRYVRLGGLSGTLREARSELMATYGLSVRCVPLRRPGRRVVLPARLCADQASLWAAAAQGAAAMHRQGRPVLLAADSVAEADALAQQIAALGLPHTLLHARNDHDEAHIVARAGQRGAITVTTNLSGRGTDIELGPGVEALGGLHVISCQLNGARRIDRQLAGRAARQGDAGSVQTLLSPDTSLLARTLPAPLRALLRRCAPALPAAAVRLIARAPQWAEERRQREQRRRLIEHDERCARRLGFVGSLE